ncbi:hypothetical protein ACJJIL_23485 (plasmid) [Microbulbifer sp. EKSA005]|uniref:hypothetical protein n=1 Tax=Microbulbifer sp. EKSA005 TaxID=3243364 RepID=UPI004041EBAB
MNRKSVAATVNAVCFEKFVEAETPDGTLIRYVHVFDRPYDKEQIGITEDGFWCVATSSIVWQVKSVHQAHFFYLFFYSKIAHVIELIKEGLKNLGLPENALMTFPFDELVIGALQGGWRKQALDWIDQGYPLNDEMILILCDNDKQSKLWINHQKERFHDLFNI